MVWDWEHILLFCFFRWSSDCTLRPTMVKQKRIGSVGSFNCPVDMSHWWNYFAHPAPQPQNDLTSTQFLKDKWNRALQWGWGSGVVFDKGNGCQLFAELFQYDHPLQKRHVVDATTTSPNVRNDFKTPTQKTSLKHWKHVHDALWLQT